MSPTNDLGLGEVHVGSLPQMSPPPPSDQGSQNSGQTTNDDSGFGHEALASLLVGMVDLVCAKAYGMPLTEIESGMLTKTTIPVLRKYMDGPMAPEWALAGTAAIIILPRYVAAKYTAQTEESINDSAGVGGQGVRQEPSTPKPGGGSLSALSDMLNPGT